MFPLCSHLVPSLFPQLLIAPSTCQISVFSLFTLFVPTFPRFCGNRAGVAFRCNKLTLLWHAGTKKPPRWAAAGGKVAGQCLAAVCPQWQHIPLAQGVQIVGPCLQHAAALLHKLGTVAGAPVQVFHAVGQLRLDGGTVKALILGHTADPRPAGVEHSMRQPHSAKSRL